VDSRARRTVARQVMRGDTLCWKIIDVLEIEKPGAKDVSARGNAGMTASG
jgi:hypothetical protein